MTSYSYSYSSRSAYSGGAYREQTSNRNETNEHHTGVSSDNNQNQTAIGPCGSSQYQAVTVPYDNSQYQTVTDPCGNSQYQTVTDPCGNRQYQTAIVPCDPSLTIQEPCINGGNSVVVYTRSSEETKRKVATVTEVFDPNPEIIRQAECGGDTQKHEQRILLRYLQPPPAPEPGPLIIEKKYCLLPPLVINEVAVDIDSPPPLILREQPPTPPPPIPSETTIEWIRARPIIIQHLPASAKPRDILIDRWLPYGPPPPRRTICKPPRECPPRIKEIHCMTVKPEIVRKFKRLGVTEENPSDYIAKYGASLLDSATLVQLAYNAGVTEDISPPDRTSVRYSHVDESTDYIGRYGGSLLDPATLVQQARNAGVTEDISPPDRTSVRYPHVDEPTDYPDFENGVTHRRNPYSDGN